MAGNPAKPLFDAVLGEWLSRTESPRVAMLLQLIYADIHDAIAYTRAASAMEDVIGTGYSVVEGEALTTLPPQPPGAVFNAQEQARYREYKEEQRGAADYMALEGKFSKYLQDVYSAKDASVLRPFYEDALGLPFLGTVPLPTGTLHVFACVIWRTVKPLRSPSLRATAIV